MLNWKPLALITTTSPLSCCPQHMSSCILWIMAFRWMIHVCFFSRSLTICVIFIYSHGWLDDRMWSWTYQLTQNEEQQGMCKSMWMSVFVSCESYMSLINRVNVCNNLQKHPSRSLHDTVVVCCGCASISLPSAALIVCAAMGVAPVIWSITAVYSLELGQSDPNLQVIDSAVILRLGKL